MKIAIIGAGNIGGNLTRRFAALGHDVVVANSRGPETLADPAQETGARAVTVQDAPRGAEVLVVAIPEKNILLPDDLLADAEGLVVIDTGNC
ncbi:MAG TPA: NAD(P)-binding domain-containing protein [Solirubrobacteraceae bacterium]|jgi:predicted dinucleotide-binding enzyme|nr:NAD(P)-binding domain-containing protein [Solirubrobacteraceae bacterium]